METHRPIGGGADKLMHQRIAALTHLVGCALRGDAAIGQHNHLIGNCKGLVQIVRDHDAGQAQGIVQLANQACGCAQRNRVQAREGFVVHHQLGVQSNRSCQSHPPRHATRYFAGQQIASATQTHCFELHQDNVAHHGFGQMGVFA